MIIKYQHMDGHVDLTAAEGKKWQEEEEEEEEEDDDDELQGE